MGKHVTEGYWFGAGCVTKCSIFSKVDDLLPCDLWEVVVDERSVVEGDEAALHKLKGGDDSEEFRRRRLAEDMGWCYGFGIGQMGDIAGGSREQSFAY